MLFVTAVNSLPWLMSCFVYQGSKLNFHKNMQAFGNYIYQCLNILLSKMCLNLCITVIKFKSTLKFLVKY